MIGGDSQCAGKLIIYRGLLEALRKSNEEEGWQPIGLIFETGRMDFGSILLVLNLTAASPGLRVDY